MPWQQLKGQHNGGQVPERFREIVAPHLESYNYFIQHGMREVVDRLPPLEFKVEHNGRTRLIRLIIDNITVDKPKLEGCPLYPAFCRQSGSSYKASASLDVVVQIDPQGKAGDLSHRIKHPFGGIPAMVGSVVCWTSGLNTAQLIKRKEEGNEMGGYFICNGLERIIRMLIMQKRHYVVALKRKTMMNRSPNFTPYATAIRSVQADERGATTRCYYCNDGSVVTGITVGSREAFIPTAILLQATTKMSDAEIFQHILSAAAPPDPSNPADFYIFMARRVEILLDQGKQHGVHTNEQAICFLGENFRSSMGFDEFPEYTDHQTGVHFLRTNVLIHCDEKYLSEKFLLLVLMLQKLYALVAGQCSEDNVDSLAHHELLLPGQLMTKAFRERLIDWQEDFKKIVIRDCRKNPGRVDFMASKYISTVCAGIPDMGQRLDYMINTGNFRFDQTRRRPDVPQTTGFTVVAEKLNWFRYISHFRSVHRGAYFNDSRTSSVRKLLPESWGFMCPVHTPDGAPCGLLSHMAAMCQVVTSPILDDAEFKQGMMKVLVKFGMRSASGVDPPPSRPHSLPVCLDGNVVGYVEESGAQVLVDCIKDVKAARRAMEALTQPHRQLKGSELLVPAHLEIAYFPDVKGGPFPGVYLFSTMSRMVRPVRQLREGDIVELIGPLEQINMNIRCPDGGSGGSVGLHFTHEELNNMAMLSIVSSLTPYSNFNQSPRNMYQCQMAKQTMGNPMHSYPYRPDGKLYRLLMPQTPIAKTCRYDDYKMDEYPNGTNAIVAVLSYTGYDMEDGMILNAGSVDRGFAHATMYKTDSIDARQMSINAELRPPKGPRKPYEKKAKEDLGLWESEYPVPCPSQPNFKSVKSKGVCPEPPHMHGATVDIDGLPFVGAAIHPGDVYYNIHDESSGKKDKQGMLKGQENAIVDSVCLIGSGGKDGNKRDRANVKMRINRNPIIGDKFSSRHGQKGVLSKLWPDIDMPFCPGTGMRPDLIINPNAFPSRMTIGMLIESMAAKAGALRAEWVDATPFQTAGKAEKPHEVFGKMLEEAGFARHGGETMISGATGEEFPADIYIGVVYYQRLRHMVSDKYQVRSVGSVDPVLLQPIKGRKVGGGIRFGEMERDSLLAHGCAYLLHDRLHASSDYNPVQVCQRCGCLISAMWSTFKQPKHLEMNAYMKADGSGGRWVCKLCNSSQYLEEISIPAVFRYLVVELGAMNIKVKLHTRDPRLMAEP